jgi:O-antigen ligase
MLNKSVEKTISTILFLGVPLTSIFLMTDSVTDPVNVTKLFVAGVVGFASFSVALIYGRTELWSNSKTLILCLLLFVAMSLNSVIQSESPLTANFYGVFGRQTGFLTYVILALIALSASLLRTKKSFDRLVWGLVFTGTVNIIYCGWALVFGDFINWSNPYGNILGLFGNPDFISAFLGMSIAAMIGYTFRKSLPWYYRLGLVVLSFIALIEIKKSHAIQGLVVTGVGLAIVGFYLVRSRFSNKLVAIYVIVVGVVGGVALAGALQKGPLASLIYKTSVSLRGQYWKAGLTMGSEHPFTGVGMDSYGDWYRRSRSEYAATVLPGARTITNAAHNVVIDFFAYGGYPLLISYLAVISIGIWSVFRVTARAKEYDGVFVALVAAWASYELQSIISINQIGLAIWGWLLVGALVAYEYTSRPNKELKQNPENTRQKDLVFSPQLIAGIGAVIGALIAVPPLSADMKWRSALKSQNVQSVELALTTSYLTPRDSQRLAQAVLLFENSKLYDLAYKYAKIGVTFNPNYFDAWSVLQSISKSSQSEKDEALNNMKRLDPRNPNVLAR